MVCVPSGTHFRILLVTLAQVVGQLCRGDYQWRDDGVVMLRNQSADGPEFV